MAITPELLVPSTFQHYLLGLFAVANNFPASGTFLNLSQGLPSSHGRRVIRITPSPACCRASAA
jgi:multiple antibiotic resistance protein